MTIGKGSFKGARLRLVAVLSAAFVVILCANAQADTPGTAQDAGTDATQTPVSDATIGP